MGARVAGVAGRQLGQEGRLYSGYCQLDHLVLLPEVCESESIPCVGLSLKTDPSLEMELPLLHSPIAPTINNTQLDILALIIDGIGKLILS